MPPTHQQPTKLSIREMGLILGLIATFLANIGGTAAKLLLSQSPSPEQVSLQKRIDDMNTTLTQMQITLGQQKYQIEAMQREQERQHR